MGGLPSHRPPPPLPTEASWSHLGHRAAIHEGQPSHVTPPGKCFLVVRDPRHLDTSYPEDPQPFWPALGAPKPLCWRPGW